jgi:hypothetical protein
MVYHARMDFMHIVERGSTHLATLGSMKEAYPVEVVNFAVTHGLSNRVAFRWWVPHVLQQKDRIIKAIKTRYEKGTHKYGIHFPKIIEEAYTIDQENGNDLWPQAISKETKNNTVAFKFLEHGVSIPLGSKWVPFHMIFDVKVDLTSKARFVAGGHWMNVPSHLTYSSVVTRESIRIAFLIATLNDLQI